MKLENTRWGINEFGNYYSYHITLNYLGDNVPKYHVLKIDGNWVVGVFYPLYDEYVPLNETEEQIHFKSSIEAMNFVDNVLEN